MSFKDFLFLALAAILFSKPLLSISAMTHCLSVMHAPVKFHEYIPYCLGVTAQTWFTIWN